MTGARRELCFWTELESFGAKTALVHGAERITYQDLARRADNWATETKRSVGMERPLVLLEASNQPMAIVAYLGALRQNWPVILTEPGRAAFLAGVRQAFEPNLIVRCNGRDLEKEVACTRPVEMSPELRILLSTSGTTGSAKLVRLSEKNISSNTGAIVSYLSLTAEDTGISSLPWFYSYGMSVLNTQLAVGGTFVLADHPTTATEFWELARQWRVSVLPLVPLQVELLEKSGFSRDQLPSLRMVLQVRGKVPKNVARAFKTVSDREGWDFVPMYGQTEASPRISYVPVDASLDDIDTIGQAIPGGELTIVDEDRNTISQAGIPGELVYRGPNVMMGYATTRDDLRNAHQLSALNTGDIAELTASGLFRIVGRKSRFIKPNGLRLNLDEIEAYLRRNQVTGYCSGTDDLLAVFVVGIPIMGSLETDLKEKFKLGTNQVKVSYLDQVPTLPSGKVDYRSLREMAAAQPAAPAGKSDDLLSVLRQALGVEHIDLSQSFSDYGGDSLAYLEVELFLSNSGRDVPEGWERIPIRDLLRLENDERPADGPTTRVVPMELLFRIAAIVAILANHSTRFYLGGGAYFLLVLSGYSIARFQSASLFKGEVLRVALRSVGKVLIWYYLILIFVHFTWTPVKADWWFLLGNYDETGNERTKINFYWYISALVQVVVLACIPFLIPKVRKWASGSPLAGGAVILISASLAFEYAGVMDVEAAHRLRHTIGAFQLAALGWCLFFATTKDSKIVLSFVVVALLATHWHDAAPLALMFISIGSIGILFGFKVHLKPVVASATTYLASLTLFIYLFHPFVLAVVQRFGQGPPDERWSNTSMFVATLLGSVMIAGSAQLVTQKLEPVLNRLLRYLGSASPSVGKRERKTERATSFGPNSR
ncbi:AMP-binding protein [Ruegeria sp.]|uniref:AMP-binding protein n=1 Tax=Ruegeria sp. TaxID=1879320 RepID=UPI003B5AB129